MGNGSGLLGLKQISGQTQIIFTVKSFIALIVFILGIFYGFYQAVVVPKVNSTESHYSTMYNDQKEQNRLFYQELGKINTSIGSLGASVDAINRAGVNQQRPNSGNGSLGATIVPTDTTSSHIKTYNNTAQNSHN